MVQCVQWAMRSLQQVEITYPPQAILGYAEPDQSRGASVETDVSLTDVSLLPFSMASAGDML